MSNKTFYLKDWLTPPVAVACATVCMTESLNVFSGAADAAFGDMTIAGFDTATAAVMDAAMVIDAPALAPVAVVQPTALAPSDASGATASDVPAEPDPFAALGLAAPLLAAIRDLGFTTPTPVQMKTIPLAMKSQASGAKYNDLMVSSQTGSGKTAAYLLPVLHTLHADVREREQQAQEEHKRQVAEGKATYNKRKNPNNFRNFKPATPGALILCPTRELAQQVANDAIDLARHMQGVRVATVIGGLPYQQQIARLQNATLVVATPGRLLDLQRSRQIQCESVKFLVVDEADRMLDLGFSDDLAEINQLTIERQQTMMFSATFEARIQVLAKRVMREPQRVTIDTPQERHTNIKQSLYWADSMSHRRKVLDHLMRDTTIAQAIVFVSTQLECDGLAGDLAEAGFSAGALHGALSQRLRNTRLGLLREGRIQFLIATDVAARGIDVPNISHVFNYGLPMKAEDYVHRIGRTGRAGRNGIAITIAEHRDRRKVGDIEHYTKQRFTAQVVPGLEPSAPKREAPTRKDRDRGANRGFGGGDQRPPMRDSYRPPARSFDRAPFERAAFDRAPSRDHQHAPRQDATFAPRHDTQHAPRDWNHAPARDNHHAPARDGGFAPGRNRDFAPPRDRDFAASRPRDFAPPRDGFHAPKPWAAGPKPRPGAFAKGPGGAAAHKGARPGKGPSGPHTAKPFANPFDEKRRPAKKFPA